MYCERCGKQIDDTLNFCNSCGAQLKKDDESGKSIISSLTNALISVVVVGLGVLVGLVAILLDKVEKVDAIFTFAVVYLLIIFAISFLIMRQISRLINADLESKKIQLEARQTVQLPPRSTNQLEEFREPASVTDHTTRTLKNIPFRER